MLIDILTIITAIIAITIFISGLLTFLRNPYLKENRWFFIFTLSLAIWLMSNYIDSNIVKHNLTVIMGKLDFSFALILAWSFMKFLVEMLHAIGKPFSDKKYLADSKPFQYISLSLITLFVVGIITDKVINISIATGSLTVNGGLLYDLYDVLLLFIFLYPLIILGRSYRKIPTTKRQGIKLLCLGYLVALAANLLTNLLFPSLFTSRPVVQSLNLFGYLGLLVFVLLIYLAITSRHLFDIKLAIARSLSYISLLTLIGFVFSSLSILISQSLSHTHLKLSFIITDTILAFVLAITFQYIRALFTKISDRLFFKDKYDPQIVINDLNNIITSTLNIEEIVKKSINLLKQTLKAQYCCFVIEDSSERLRVYSDQQNGIDF